MHYPANGPWLNFQAVQNTRIIGKIEPLPTLNVNMFNTSFKESPLPSSQERQYKWVLQSKVAQLSWWKSSTKAQALPHGRAPHWWCLESYGFFGESSFGILKTVPKNFRDKHFWNNVTNWFPKFLVTESTVCFWDNLKLGFHKVSFVPMSPKVPCQYHCWGGLRETSCFGNQMSWKKWQKRHKKSPTPNVQAFFGLSESSLHPAP